MTERYPMPCPDDARDSFPARSAVDHGTPGTPPGEASKPPEGLSRRLALAGLAGLPVALPAAAAAEPDLIYSVVERHRELSDQLSAAASVSAKLMDGPEFEAADNITTERVEALREYTDTLIRTEPTTMAGAVALTRYIAGLGVWQLPDDEEDTPTSHQLFLNTLADALDNLRARG